MSDEKKEAFNIRKHDHNLNDPGRREYISSWRKKAKEGGVKFLDDFYYDNHLTVAYVAHSSYASETKDTKDYNITVGEIAFTICSSEEPFHKGLGRAIATDRLFNPDLTKRIAFRVSTSRFERNENAFIYALVVNHLDKMALLGEDGVPQEVSSLVFN